MLIAPAPHTVARNSVQRVMLLVLLALAPAVLVQAVFFGPGLLVQLLLACAAALLTEAVALRLRGRPVIRFLTDGTALITAVLLALCMPPLAPWWLVVSGCAFAIGFAKHAYGGLGANPFNPAMVGYAVLLVSFPAHLSHWLPPQLDAMPGTQLGLGETLLTILRGELPARLSWDGVTSATPLDAIRTGLRTGLTLDEIRTGSSLGALGGPGHEWINLAVLAGGVWLLAARIINWHIPAAVLVGMIVPASLMSAIDPGTYPGPVFHVTAGASMLGAFFIATDPISAATSNLGRLIYGAGIGVFTYVIRTWGGYPDGIAFAVLLMNLAVPWIDRHTVPRVYGHTE
jgi:Na+-translocating ferredoxin:NAD+ oxidoreductase subunit D